MIKITKYVLIGVVLASLMGCGKGPKGDTGSVGVAGPTGGVGQPGTAGTNGTDATPTTVVALCSGFIPTYPSVFPEYAICLQGQLYGVYSDHGGFLALLPPGEYSSNGINASCTFTIHANCEIT